MGQCPIAGVVPSSQELKWKSGRKTSAIPSPHGSVPTYEKLTLSSEFKDSLIEYLDSDYLISSILDPGAMEDQTLLSDIAVLKGFDADFKARIEQQDKNFRKVNLAGIDVKLSENLDHIENSIALLQSFQSSPYLRSFQRRLVALRGVESCIARERKLASEKKRFREYSFRPSLQPGTFPQLLPLMALQESGLSLINLFPLIFETMEKTEHKQQLTRPIVSLHDELAAIPKLSLFSCWSPPPVPVVRVLNIDAQNVSSSTGTASDAIDGKPNNGWSGNKSGSTWTVTVPDSEQISFIKIAWASSSSPLVIGAPKTLTISSSSIVDGKSVDLEIFDIQGEFTLDQEFKKQNSWTQVYPVRIKCPAKIQLSLSKVATANNSPTGTKMFGIELGVEDDSMKSGNILKLLRSLQQSLVGLGKYEMVESPVCKSMTYIPIMSGSLSLCLDLFDFMHFMELGNIIKRAAAFQFLELLVSIYSVESEVLLASNGNQGNVERVREDVIFDDKYKSSDCTLTEGGMFATFTSSSAYVMANCPMEHGVWTWEISVSQDTRGDETSCLGVARRPLASSSYDNNGNVWVVRCYNGETYHSGRRERRPLTTIHPKDVCRFTYDCEAETLSLCINDADQGVIFDDVPNGVYIYASFYSSSKSVRLLSVKHHGGPSDENSKQNGIASLPADFISRIPTTEYLSTQDDWGIALLESIATLSTAQASHAAATSQSVNGCVDNKFGIEVSIDVFEKIVSYLKRCMERISLSDYKPVAERIIFSILKILDAQLVVLLESNVDFAEIGFAYEQSRLESCLVGERGTSVVLGDITFLAGRPKTVLNEMYGVLSSLRASESADIQLCAATVIARGASLLFPNVADKLQLVVETFDAIEIVCTQHSDSSRVDSLNTCNLALLSLLFDQIKYAPELVHLLNVLKGGILGHSLIFDVVDTLIMILSLSDKFVDLPLPYPRHAHAARFVSKHEGIRRQAYSILALLQQHVVYEYSSCLPQYVESAKALIRSFFTTFCDHVLSVGTSICSTIVTFSAENYDDMIEDNLLLKLSLPLIHSLCFCADSCETVRSLLSVVVDFLSALTAICSQSSSCTLAASNLAATLLRQIPDDSSDSHKSVGSSGWKRIRGAQFETGESTFSVLEEGMMYNSTHSSNTCGLVLFDLARYNKLAWEFELVADSTNDQCSVFGASRRNPSSRCYSSSTDLWMRRAYNGYMYNNGTTTGSNMDKIQPGDIVRIEHDIKAGTISYSVNSGPLEVGFSDVFEQVYPAAGSYRNGVQIRLLKLESCGGAAGSDAVAHSKLRNPDVVSWVPTVKMALSAAFQRDPAVLTQIKSTSTKEEKKSDKEILDTKCDWTTVRADTGAQSGIHEWSFEILERSKTPFAFGIVYGGEPFGSDFLAGPCFSDTRDESDSEHASQSTAKPGTDGASEVIETPSDTNSPETTIIGISESCSASIEPVSEPKANSLVNNNSQISLFEYGVVGSGVHALSWHTSGELWHNGVKIADNFGKKFLPLDKLTTISIRINRERHTIEYYVNGESVGIAFGPDDSSAVAKVSFVESPMGCAWYPAASISSPSQSIRIRPTGFYGSLILPRSLFLQKSCSAIVGRLVAVLLAGPPVDKREASLIPWLQSPLLIGGKSLQKRTNDSAPKDFFSNGLYSVARSSTEFLERIAANTDGVPSFLEGEVLLEWLESINPEPTFLRKNLESKGSYRFLQCELPFLAALMKHSGLSNEVFLMVTQAIETGQQVSSTAAPAIDEPASHDSDPLAIRETITIEMQTHRPSGDVLSLWTRVKQLRSQLRKERQNFNAVSSQETVAVVPVSIDESKQNIEVTPNEVAALSVPAATPPEASTPPTAVASPAAAIVPISRSPLEMLINGDVDMWGRESTGWRLQAVGAVGRYDTSTADYHCRVLAVGFDVSSSAMLVRIHVEGDGSLGDLQSSLDSRILFGDNDDDDLFLRVGGREDVYFAAESRNEIIATLRYEAISADMLEAGPCSFWYGSSGYTRVELQLPSQSDNGNYATFNSNVMSTLAAAQSIDQETKVIPKTFEEYCQIIVDKALFLLEFEPSIEMDASEAKSRSIFSAMLETSSVGALPTPGGKPGRWKSDDGDQRWKRVIEFLCVHSKIRKQNSTDSFRMTSASSLASLEQDLIRNRLTSDASAVGDDLNAVSGRRSDNIVTLQDELFLRESSSFAELDTDPAEASPAQSFMQLCALFICGDTIPLSPTLLEAVLAFRSERASSRAFALEILAKIISIPTFVDDLYSIENVLLLVKSSLRNTANIKGELSGFGKSKIHYLSNLEGCAVDTLATVQEGFLVFYANLSRLMGKYISRWEHCEPIVSQIEEQKPFRGSEAESDSHLYLNPMRMMLSLWSIHFSCRDHRFIMQSGILPALYKLISLPTFESAVQTWVLAASKLSKFIKTYSPYFPLSAVKWNIWSNSYVEEGLQNGSLSTRSILFHLSTLPISRLSSEELSSCHELQQDFLTLVGSQGLSQTSLLFQNVSTLIRRRILSFEANREHEIKKIDSEITANQEKIYELLSRSGKFDLSHVAPNIVLSNHDVVASIPPESTDHEPLCVMATISYNVTSDIQVSGNYFEVEILALGRADIGVGLCNREVLPLKARMPGWDPSGSYGYHGDDGKKFGPGATDGDWPLWASGDVIGCGIDVRRRAIFYTRNGVLLGDAFTNVTESVLWPVVGFANSVTSRKKEKVSINFGCKPFRYSGPEIVVNSDALRDRESVEILMKTSLALANELATVTLDTAVSPFISSKDWIPNDASECQLSEKEYMDQLKALQKSFDSARAFLFELSSIRSLALATLVFLLIVTRMSEDESSSSSAVIANPVDNSASVSSTVSPSAPRNLLKGISLFGTPKSITTADGRNLQEAILSALIEEVSLGSDYLLLFYQTKGALAPGSSVMSCPPPFGNQQTISDLQRASFGTNEIANSTNGLPTADSNDRHVVVEAAEVENVIFEHISAISSLLSNSPMLIEELSSSRVLRSLFNLLLCGSPRLKQLVYKILLACLPSLSPEDAENCISSSWREYLSQIAPDGESSAARLATPNGSRRRRRMPDSILRVLLSQIQLSLISGSSISSQSSPYGVGQNVLINADHCICLIQKLFETPSWTEIVACSLTDSFRDASVVLEAVNSSLAASGKMVSKSAFDAMVSSEQRRALVVACSTLACLSGLGLLRPGVRVKSLEGASSGSEGYLVSISENEDSACVLFADKKFVESLDKLEILPLTQIQVVWESISVDLSRLSQPLLPQLMQLMKNSMQFTLNCRKFMSDSNIGPCETEMIAQRVSSHCAISLSVLIDKFSDQLVDSIIDAELISDIVHLSLIPSGLPHFPNISTVHSSWLFVQSRQLEIATSKSVEAFQAAKTEEICIGKAESSVTQNNECIAPEQVFVTVESQDCCLATTAQSMAEELGLEADVCQRRLDFFMGNAALARVSLLVSGESIEDIAIDGQNSINDLPPASNLQEFHTLLTTAESGDGKESSKIEQCRKSSDSFPFKLDKIITLPHHEPRSDGSASEATCIQAGEILCRSDCDGLVTSAGGKIGLCVQSGLAAEDITVALYDRFRGTICHELIPTSSLRRVVSFYNTKAPNLDTFISRLLFATIVLRMRIIASKLLIDGSINIKKDVADINDWLSLIKLVSASSQNNAVMDLDLVDKIKLSSMCSSLMSRSRIVNQPIESSTSKALLLVADDTEGLASSAVTTVDQLLIAVSPSTSNEVASGEVDVDTELQQAVSEMLARDVHDGLVSLSECNLLTPLSSSALCVSQNVGKTSQIVETSYSISGNFVDCSTDNKKLGSMKFSSPHPFMSPCTVSGLIKIPAEWPGSLVLFHRKCSTPSNEACLKFYASESDQINDKPLYRYFGPERNSQFFAPIVFPPGQDIFYRFDAKSGSDIPPVKLITAAGSVENSEIRGMPTIPKPGEGPVGLGDDDTLANLFGMGEPSSSDPSTRLPEFDTSTFLADISGVQVGSWFFEATVGTNNCEKDIRAILTPTSHVAVDDLLESTVRERIHEQLDRNRIGLVVESFSPENAVPLGSSSGSVAISALGMVSYSSFEQENNVVTVQHASMDSWLSGDVVGLAFNLSPAGLTVCFSKNGNWSVENVIVIPGLVGTWRKPAVQLSGQVNLSLNFGSLPFSFPPPIDLFRNSSIQQTFLAMVSRPVNEATKLLAWGYCFQVQPLTDLNVRVSRLFDQICTRETEEKSAGKDDDGVTMSFWRPKPIGDFYPCCDIISNSTTPPVGGWLVDRRQCQPAVSFKKVFSSGDNKFFVWRPEAPPGYVAMGDLVSPSSTKPNAKQCMCLPLWAVIPADLDRRVLFMKKAASLGGKDKNCTAGIWSTFSGLGTFFGNPGGNLGAMSPKIETEVEIVTSCYKLKTNDGVVSLMEGEWYSEPVVLTHPSLSWSSALFGVLLDHPFSRQKLLTPAMFDILVNYLKSTSAPNPMKVVSLLIQFIRAAYHTNNPISLPLQNIEGLCKTILLKAVAKRDKGATLSDQLLSLVDLVVEVISVQVAADLGETDERFTVPEPIAPSVSAVAKPLPLTREESGVVWDPEDDDHAHLDEQPCLVTGSKDSSSSVRCLNWWDRSSLDRQTLEISRLLALKKIEPVFAKDPLLRRLKFAIKFFSALGNSQRRTMPGRISVPSKSVTFPKRIICKLWYDHASTCLSDQSSHPYSLETKYERVLRIPGAERIVIYFDSRCALGEGAILRLKSQNLTVSMDKSSFSNSACSPLMLEGDTVEISFVGANSLLGTVRKSDVELKSAGGVGAESLVPPNDESLSSTVASDTSVPVMDESSLGEPTSKVDGDIASTSAPGSPAANEWGWAILVQAGGPIYEVTESLVDVPMTETWINNDAIADHEPFTSFSCTKEQVDQGKFESDPQMPSLILDSASAEVENSAVKLIWENDSREPAISTLPTDELPDKERPVSRRQRRGNSGDNTGVDLAEREFDRSIVKKIVDKVVRGELTKDSAILQIAFVAGHQISSDILSVPHATSMELSFARTGPIEKLDLSVLYVARLWSAVDGKITLDDCFVRLPSVDTIAVCIVPTNSIHYSINVVSEVAVNAIFDEFEHEANRESEQMAEGTKLESNAEESADSLAKTATAEELAPPNEVAVSTGVVDPDAPWSCPLCTMMNPVGDDVCCMCMTPRATSTAATSGTSAVMSATGAGWWCQVCTFINELSQTSCAICGSNRTEGESASASAPNPDEHAGEEVVDDQDVPDSSDENSSTASDSHSDEEDDRSVRQRSRSRSADAVSASERAGSTVESTSNELNPDSVPKVSSGKDEQKSEIKVRYTPVKESKSVTLHSAWKNASKSSTKDSFYISAKGQFSNVARFETRLEGILMHKGLGLTPLDIQKSLVDWTAPMDSNLLEILNQLQSKSSKSLDSTIGSLSLTKTQLDYSASNLAHKSMLDVQNRALLIHFLNKALEDILPICNLGSNDPLSFGATIRKYSMYVFMSLKTPLLEKAIKQSAASSGSGIPAQLTLDNFKALSSRDKGEIDPSTSQCVFVQAFRQLQGKDSAVFRHTFSDNRVFQINFTGESGIDAGGVFREGVSRMVEDLFSEHFNLLLLCPNGQHSVHINTDKYVPNPQHTGPLAMQMFEFLGRLLGMSLRAKLSLPFEFPSIIWKKLIGEEVVVEDLMNIDALTVRLLDAIRNCENDGIVDQASFSAKYSDQLSFVYNGSDGVERELVKGQRNRRVTFDSRIEYCDLVLQARLSEFDKQVSAMTKGLLEVVPTRILQLFSASQVDILVAGNPSFDFELWKSKTETSGVNPKTVSLFWEVMESLSQKELAGFVRFAWGRSRLPTAKDFTTKMKLTSAGSARLPVAHTCFFSIEMPEYSTIAEMRHGLLTVINFGVGGILNG